MIHKFKKWLSGEITWEEEKQLRKEAAKDSMLADAMEGYEYFPNADHQQKIHHLNKRIRQRTGTSTNSNTFTLRAIAASLVLLISVGLFWMVNQNWSLSSTENIAYQAPKETLVTKEAIEVSSVQEKPKQSPPIVSAPTPSKSAIKRSAGSDKIVSTSTTSPSASVPPAKKQRSIEPAPSTSAQQEVLPENFHTPTIAKEVIAVEAPITEEVPASTAASSSDEAIVTAFDKSAEEVLKKEKKREEIEDQQDAASIALSRQASSRSSLEQREDYLAAAPSMPKKELLQFFLQENLRYPKKAKRKKVNGTLKLQYQLDRDNNLNNLKIIDSLGFGCEEEAIRLLRSAPIHLLSSEGDTVFIKFGQ